MFASIVVTPSPEQNTRYDAVAPSFSCLPPNNWKLELSSGDNFHLDANMSWLARSIANSLKLEDDFEDNRLPNTDADATNPKPEDSQSDQNQNQSTADTPRGVKGDLTELTKSFSRQLWGVASFLAPPPSPPPQQQPEMSDQNKSSDEFSDPDVAGEDVIEGIKSDFAEISGKFRSGISMLSNNINVSEITKMASNFLQFTSEMELNEDVGVTEEVLLFARNIAVHPETWLDFPVPDDEYFDGTIPISVI